MNRHQQEAKKYLSQAFGLNQRIESKLGQIEDLHDLATKATVTYSDMPKSPNRDGSRMEDAIIKIIDLENEINQDMMKLVELKKDIIRRIKAVESAELQTILELRYLSYMRWEEIAIELGYGIDNVFRLHRNDYYSKDLSVKVTTAKRAKMKRGEYIGGHVPFGLMKDPEDYHKLMIDPEAASIVREIFEAAISGMRITDIARMLNKKGYETPARYYQRKHPEKNKFKNTSELDCWNHNSVRRTLKQEMYHGAVVGHRREGIGVGWKHSVAIPKDEQIIVEGKHPGIVTKEEFMEAQKIFRKRRETKQVTDKSYPLWKKVRCGTCGRAMPFKDRIIRGRPYRYFGCPHSQAQVGDGGCSKEYIREDVLNEVVWEFIKVLLSTAEDAKKKVRQRQQEADRDNSRLVKKLAKLQKDREKCDAERFANVDQFMAGTLDKDVYQSRRTDLIRRAERLDAEIAELEERLHEAEVVQDDGMQDALETLDKFSGATELDQKIVQALVDKVVVYDPRHVEIRWKFSDEVLKLLQE